MYSYETKGVCSRRINFNIENNIVKSVEFIGGCPGNLFRILALLKVWM